MIAGSRLLLGEAIILYLFWVEISDDYLRHTLVTLPPGETRKDGARDGESKGNGQEQQVQPALKWKGQVKVDCTTCIANIRNPKNA